MRIGIMINKTSKWKEFAEKRWKNGKIAVSLQPKL